HAGNRVKKTENNVTTYYINKYYELEGSTAIKYYYANGQRIAKNDEGTLTFYHADHLGGSSRITNTSGTEVSRIGYLPYGSDAYSSGSGDEPVYKFTGKEQDATGLYYYGARYYDPALGRFISPDAMGDNYVYCGNNPVGRIDPDGNSWQKAHDFLYSAFSHLDYAQRSVVSGIFATTIHPEAPAGFDCPVSPAEMHQRRTGTYNELMNTSTTGGKVVEGISATAFAGGQAKTGITVGKKLQKIERGGLVQEYIRRGGKTTGDLSPITAVSTGVQSFASEGGYDPYAHTVNYASFEAFGFLAGAPISYTAGKIGGMLGRVIANVVFGNMYGAVLPFSTYAQTGEWVGFWSDAFWETRPLWIEVNTGIGIVSSLAPNQYDPLITAAGRGIGVYYQKKAESEGCNVNDVIPLGNELQQGVDWVRDKLGK
ncbi:MAG: RHS repeat-associated core domain-containing protein, partial [Desulfobacterales bacterium]|nr:RHS repeat-associated core domain-containing protein [Desulfobacterales bacterium]